MFLGIEIGGTKLQIAAGRGEGEAFRGLWRGMIDPQAGAARIQQQIVAGVDELLRQSELARRDIAAVGIGFGGPVDSAAGTIVVSNQVPGWQGFPLVSWLWETFGWPAALHNDADSAALAEARFGAGQGFDPVMYVTVGSGIGGGLVISGKVFRGEGAGAMEIGHLRPPQAVLRIPLPAPSVESVASGFGIEQRARQTFSDWLEAHPPAAGKDATELPERFQRLLGPSWGGAAKVTTKAIAAAALEGDQFSSDLLADATDTLGWALAQAATLINPARIVIGGGVSLIGEEYFLQPVRRAFAAAIFQPFAGLAEIVPAALGEEVVIHGALAIARDAFAR